MIKDAAQNIVVMKDVHKNYCNGKNAVVGLKNVSFAVRQGDFVALCGPSGSGKTTALNLVGALDRPDSGSIQVDGRELGAMSRRELTLLRRTAIGFIFQAFNLLPVLTALENAAFTLGLLSVPLKQRHAQAQEMLGAVGLEGLEHRFPHQLSGGQQQRVAIARAMATMPRIVLADEPTATLDTKAAMDLIALMENLNRQRGITFLFSTHDMRIIERVNRAIFLEDGAIKMERDQERAGP